jgi:UDP-N-acetylglucosamine transferase subunit ALG13
MVKEGAIDAIISDNRLGMFSKKIPSIYITHQLFIKTGNIFTENIAQGIHYHYIKKYIKCWVPDYKEDGLAGVLSHPKKVPANVEFIGPLSRLVPLQNIEPIYDLLVLLSGPEPQRTIFENQILVQLKNFSGSVFLARGLPIEEDNLNVNNKSVKVVNHIGGEDLNKVLSQSKLIIARCGYSTVMDLAAMKKTAILIPTPGQTEQEYLAEYLLEKKYFLTAPQERFILSELLKRSAAFKYELIDFSFNEYKKAIGEFVMSLNTSN